MEVSKKQYGEMVKKASPPSTVVRDCILAFVIGGLICVIGQLVCNGYLALNLQKDDAAAATSMTMIFIGALLTGLNVYDNIALYGGAGTLVPITGFANSIVSPAMEYKKEGFVLGVGVNMFKIAGPVLAFGISASVIYGMIYYFVR